MKAPTIVQYIKELDETTAMTSQFYGKVMEYVEFITQQLNIGMFVPAKEVNGKWEVLEEPIDDPYSQGTLAEYDAYKRKSREYQQALDKVILKIPSNWSIEYRNETIVINHSNGVNTYKDCSIEDILHLVELNDNGIKQAGLNKS